MYKVLARKWRPGTFAELVGQRHVARTLSNAVEADRLAHAYLFAGLRGTGKTTVARILAKCLNCERGPTTTPCGTCTPCCEIADSRALDVLEIDAASRTKVEQTRELLEMVSYAPVRDRHKILIIDEAHMLSKASFNALLKTLEEPPPNVVFVLATTELEKVLPTILSRCQVFEFRRVPTSEVSGLLRRICDAEKIGISDAALERVARAGEGSVRDSISALERIVAFCGETAADEDVLRLLGAVRAEVLNDMMAALAGHDAAGMLTVLDRVVDEGHDLVHFWSELVAAVRDLLLAQALPGRTELLGRTAEEAAALSRAAGGLTREDLSRVFRILADLEAGLRTSSLPQYLFEAALVRLASLGAVRPIEELLQSLPAGQAARETPAAPRAVPAPVAERAPSRPAAPPAVQKKKDVEASDLVNRLHGVRPLLAAVLEQAASIEFHDGTLRIGLAPSMQALRKQLEEPGSLALLRQTVAPGGEPCAIVIEVQADSDPGPARPAAGPPGRAAGGPVPTPATRPGGRPLPESLLDRMRDEPGVGKLFDAFGAQVVDVRSIEAGAGEDPAAEAEER